jgi:hypothetical protein
MDLFHLEKFHKLSPRETNLSLTKKNQEKIEKISLFENLKTLEFSTGYDTYVPTELFKNKIESLKDDNKLEKIIFPSTDDSNILSLYESSLPPEALVDFLNNLSTNSTITKLTVNDNNMEHYTDDDIKISNSSIESFCFSSNS